MELKEIQNLIKFVAKSGASEVKLEMDDVKITIRTGSDNETTIVQQVPVQAAAPVVQQQAAAPVAAAPEAPAATAPTTDDSKYITVKSPIIGTFYLATCL